MSKVIFFNVQAHGHVNPSLALVSELVQRGEKVIYYCTEEFRSLVEPTGVEFRAYQDMPPGLLDDVHGNPFILCGRMIDACGAMIPGLLEEVRAEEPDYILYDSMTPWGKMIGDHLGLPTISSMSIFALHPRIFMQIPEIFAILKLGISNLGRLQQYNRKADALEHDLGMRPLDFFTSLNSPSEMTLVYTSSLFQPNAELFGDGYKFVGPMTSPRLQDQTFPFDQLDGRPVLYISMGTVNNNVLPFYQQCLAAFDDGDYQVIMSVGGQINLADLGYIPENFIIRRHVPQLDVLQYTDVFITHGGMNSVHEAFSNNVPLIVIPQTDEQGLVAKQVARLGSGVKLDKNRLNPQVLRQAAQEVMENWRYQNGAARINESFKAAGGVKRAVDEIFAFVGHAESSVKALS